MYKKTLIGKNSRESLPPPGKELFRAFTQRHIPRLRLKYPYLPKSQVRCKVKALWDKLYAKSDGKILRDALNEKKNYDSEGIRYFSVQTSFKDIGLVGRPI